MSGRRLVATFVNDRQQKHDRPALSHFVREEDALFGERAIVKDSRVSPMRKAVPDETIQRRNSVPTILSARLDELQVDARRLQLEDNHGPLAVLRQLLGRESEIAALGANDTGAFVFTNAAASTLTAYSATELRRLSVWQLTPGVQEREAEVLWRAFLEQREQHGEYQVLTKDGRIITAAYAARVHFLPGLHLSLLRTVPPA